MVSYTESEGELYITYEAETAAELVEMVRGIKGLQEIVNDYEPLIIRQTVVSEKDCSCGDKCTNKTFSLPDSSVSPIALKSKSILEKHGINISIKENIYKNTGESECKIVFPKFF